ncbi:MAG: YqhA family protein [Muribaculaceae bacterium]
MTDLHQLRRSIIADGTLSEAVITHLREAIFDEEGVTIAKANFLFDLKDTIQVKLIEADDRRRRKQGGDSFRKIFIDAITNLLLEDESSPGEIDVNEAKWLRAKMQNKGYYDRTDILLLDELKHRSINFPEILQYKNKFWRTLESGLYLSRYLTIVAAIGSVIGALALFVEGSKEVLHGVKNLVLGTGNHDELLSAFVSSVDIYLFAMVLVIFGVGIYELFINKIDPVLNNQTVRPSWLQISSIDDLKSSLGKVILMVLIVSFLSITLTHKTAYSEPLHLLYLAGGVLLVALALYIASIHHKNDHK